MTTPTYPGPAYRIHTARLVLRCWDPGDAPRVNAASAESAEHLRTFLPWAANYPQDLQVTLDQMRTFRGSFDLGQDFVYGIFSSDETRVLGGTGLHNRVGADALEIGYWIRADAVRQGYASEASMALTRAAFEIHGVRRVEIHCAAENAASAAIPRKLGYQLEATLRARTLLLDGQYHDMLVWTLQRGEYPATPSAALPIQAFDALGRQIL